MTDGREAERTAARAARLLDQPGAWLQEAGGGYQVRLNLDGRRRSAMRLDEAGFAWLTREPGLAVRAEGGWRLARGARPAAESPPAQAVPAAVPAAASGGRPGESALHRLALRKETGGEPWLTAAEAAAGLRLEGDWERSGTLGRLTMRWEAGPRSRGGRGPGVDPLERGTAARARVRSALAAVGPELARPLQLVCLRGMGLGELEAALRLRRRTGRVLLKRALARLAEHYRLG